MRQPPSLEAEAESVLKESKTELAAEAVQGAFASPQVPAEDAAGAEEPQHGGRPAKQSLSSSCYAQSLTDMNAAGSLGVRDLCPPRQPTTALQNLTEAFPAEDGDESVDFSPVEAPEAVAFETSAEFKKDLGVPVSDSIAAAVSADAEHAVARADVLPAPLHLPAFLQPERGAWREKSAEMAQMQATKEREVEHVRHRSAELYPQDVEIQAALQGAA